MTAAKVVDVVARLPDFDGQAADAVSAYTQIKMEDAPTLLRIPKLESPDVWIRFPRHQWPKPWGNIEDPVVRLARNLNGHPLACLLRETFCGSFNGTWMGKSAEMGMLICSSKTRIFVIG